MKLLNAINKRVKWCTISTENNNRKISVDAELNYTANFELNNYDFERDDWKIIPAKPKVLSAEKWVDYIFWLEQATQTYKELAAKAEQPPVRLPYIIKRVAKDSFIEGRKNGRLEMHQEFEPLIEAANKITVHYPNDFYDLKQQLKNLPKP